MQPQRLRCRATATDHGGLDGHLRSAQAGEDALGLSPVDEPAGETNGRRAIS